MASMYFKCPHCRDVNDPTSRASGDSYRWDDEATHLFEKLVGADI